MFEWLNDNRASIAAVIIILLTLALIWSIYIGRKQATLTANNEVFGDPQRTRGGWYWAVCGVATLMLVWFYFSWGMGRAYFPDAANEMCQVAKLEEVISPIKAALPISARYYKSTLLVERNTHQLQTLEKELPLEVFSSLERTELISLIYDVRSLMANSSNPQKLSQEARKNLHRLATKLSTLASELRSGGLGLMPTLEARAQPKWGITHIEIPILPTTTRGVLFNNISIKAKEAANLFRKIRNHPKENTIIIADVKVRISALKSANKMGKFPDRILDIRTNYVKSLERIFRRLDDGTIFPANSLDGINSAIANLDRARDEARGNLGMIETFFFPGQGVVKSRTQCTEQGSARWLPKPTDVIATFLKLSNPDIEGDGGYKGIPLLWWKWLPVSNLVAFIIPDAIADLWPGEYSRHGPDGSLNPNFKDKLLDFATGKIYLGEIPVLDGHLWDSVFRVLVALALGIFLGVPLGLFMGVSRFFKSFFDPLIELYRPVPPLAWAPLILTIFGITDDGKVFLLFMVAFAIMVISARTGASGTVLSKIRASHSLGASDKQIMWYVILPNALPEILTGIRIAIGVCWGTLVAAEILAGTTGVGFIENIARTVSDYELIWVTILIMGLLGLLFDLIMRVVIDRMIPWRGKG